MPAYEVKQFGGGISDYEDKGIPGAFKFGSNLKIRKQIDSLSCNQDLVDEGQHSSRSPSASVSPSRSVSQSPSPSFSRSASPTPSPSGSVSLSPSTTPSVSVSPSHSNSPSPSPSGAPGAGVFKDLILFFVKCSDGYTYGFGNTGYIYRRDSDAFWQIVYKDPEGTIRGAEEKPSSGGKTYLIWATLRNLNRKEIPGDSNWNDVNVAGSVQGDTWPKTNLQAADWHTMKEVGGSVMIANKSTLAMAAYDDSYTNEALDLIPGNVAKTIVERNGRAIVGTERASSPGKGINAAIDGEIPLAQIGDDGEIFFANMSDSVSAKRFPGGGHCNPGGVTNEVDQADFFEWDASALSWIDKQSVGNMALFGVYDAESGRNGVYSYGRKNKNKPFIMNLEYELDVDVIGALTHVDDLTLISYLDGSTFGVKAVDPNNKAIAVYEGLDLRSPVKKPINKTVWSLAEIFMAPLPSGASVEFWYKVNKTTGDFTRAVLADDGGNSYSIPNGRKAVFRIDAEGEIFEPRVVLNPIANLDPEVHRLRIYFNN